MRLMKSSHTLFKNYTATPAECQAIERSVCRLADRDRNKIMFLLCHLSTVDRALILFDPVKFASQVEVAKQVLDLQRSKQPVGEDESSGTGSQPPNGYATYVPSQQTSDKDPSSCKGAGPNDIRYQAGVAARQDTTPHPEALTFIRNIIREPCFFLDPNWDPLMRSEKILEYSTTGIWMENWDCQLSSPPPFPEELELEESCLGNSQAIIVWRGRQPGVYGS